MHRHDARAVPAPLTSPGGRLKPLPLFHLGAQDGAKPLPLLPQDHLLHAGHDVWQPLHSVDERAGVRRWGAGGGVERRAHPHVRGLERAQPDLAATAQDGGVRPDVELYVVLAGADRLALGRNLAYHALTPDAPASSIAISW